MPSALARASLAAVRAVPSDRADSARAICTAAVPTPLPTAWMSTVSPAPSPACVTIASHAVMNASGIAAASVNESPSGIAHHAVGVRHQLLGVRAAADEPEYAIADLPSARIGADRIDLTGELEPRNLLRRIGRRRIEPHALEQIGAVDRRRAHAHAHLAAPRLGRRHLDPLENLGAARRRDHDRFHVLRPRKARPKEPRFAADARCSLRSLIARR